MSVSGLDLIVNRTNLADAYIVPAEFPDTLPDGACLLAIDGFALTANNITYGVAADMLGYWDFFPASRDGFGRIPVWGFARVVASAHPDVTTGERVYGYVPMSTHLMVHPSQITSHGFMDVAAHRAARAPIYNQYTFVRNDAQWRADQEPMITLFRPLFTTSFLLDDLHRSNDFFGAKQIILSSASSKTSIGLAFLLSRDKPDIVQIVGLTSTGNRDFVATLGCYDRIVTYDQLDDLPNTDSAYVDMAGNADLRRQVHTRLQANLKRSTAVGMTHWQASAGLGGDLPGPKTEFFFAPAYGQQRTKDWGRDDFLSRLGGAWSSFMDHANGWVQVDQSNGPETVMTRYQTMLDGEIDPAKGHYLSMWSK